MNGSVTAPHGGKQPGLAAGIAARFGAIAATLVVQAALLFGGAGTLRWPWAWLYLGISLAVVLVNGTLLLRTSPDMVAERGRPKEMQRWDVVVSSVSGIAMYIVLPLVAGLDQRFGWPPTLSAFWHVAGAVVLTLGYGLFAWAMNANAYFSTVVRIQSERGHAVCRSGPYRFVRHPGYVGMILQGLGMPLLLGSLWALLPALAIVIPTVVRTSLEDRMLQAELPGYREYAQEVCYRLAPRIW